MVSRLLEAYAVALCESTLKTGYRGATSVDTSTVAGWPRNPTSTTTVVTALIQGWELVNYYLKSYQFKEAEERRELKLVLW